MIIAQGYNAEVHEILTEDQYILKAWRIFKNIDKKHKYPMYHIAIK